MCAYAYVYAYASVCGYVARYIVIGRQLKTPSHYTGPHLFIPRHPQGQVLVSHQFRFIFVHVPKAASTTVIVCVGVKMSAHV